jgi:protein-S-isoprenylcysteine O-methyltransferase Ste14
MAHTNVSATTAGTFPRTPGIRSVTDPRVDRAVAIVACLPFVYMAYYRVTHEGLDVPRMAMLLQYALLIATMAARRPPVRVTTKPLYWATAFVATYWSFMTLGLMDRGTAIAPLWITHGLAIASLGLMVFARLSLGRNIGFVPAQRDIVTSYAYGIVRHPIYTALFVSLLGVALRSFSPQNLLILTIGAGLFVVKTFMEEDFLSEDPTYKCYMEVVRWRWIPGLA